MARIWSQSTNSTLCTNICYITYIYKYMQILKSWHIWPYYLVLHCDLFMQTFSRMPAILLLLYTHRACAVLTYCVRSLYIKWFLSLTFLKVTEHAQKKKKSGMTKVLYRQFDQTHSWHWLICHLGKKLLTNDKFKFQV